MNVKHQYDLLVVGGGINGAAIAYLAAKAGQRVALIEKNDFASGTSSKSTKLLHGGIRYLENFEFDLVAESLKERFIQWKSAPHLVKPMRFIIPIYRGQGRPMWMMRLGVWLYDVLSGAYSFGGHEQISADAVTKIIPTIKSDGLAGAVTYYDAQMDDSRIVLENVLMAKKYGADVFNYTQLINFIKKDGKAIGAHVRQTLINEAADIMASKIIVAAGPWSDELRRQDAPLAKSALRVTKGVHLVCRGYIGPDAFLLQNNKDRRIFFMIPFCGQVLIGTTDTDYEQSADEVHCEEKDINYLLAQANQYFPKAAFGKESIISTFAGLRPMAFAPGAASKVSRKHEVMKEFSGVYYVVGGKYTTYRQIAIDALDQAGILVNEGNAHELYGSYLKPVDVKNIATRHHIDPAVINYLMSIYGSRYIDVIGLIDKDPSLRERICTCTPTIRAQVAYALQVELAQTVEDVYHRRLGLDYHDCQTRQCRLTIAQMLGKA